MSGVVVEKIEQESTSGVYIMFSVKILVFYTFEAVSTLIKKMSFTNIFELQLESTRETEWKGLKNLEHLKLSQEWE